jgi:hypothetical protein
LLNAYAPAPTKGLIMPDKSPQKDSAKKKGKTIKEKQTAKRDKRSQQEGNASKIPPTGH